MSDLKYQSTKELKSRLKEAHQLTNTGKMRMTAIDSELCKRFKDVCRWPNCNCPCSVKGGKNCGERERSEDLPVGWQDKKAEVLMADWPSPECLHPSLGVFKVKCPFCSDLLNCLRDYYMHCAEKHPEMKGKCDG